MAAWSLLSTLCSENLLSSHPSLLHDAISVVLAPQSLYSHKLLAIRFLLGTTDLLITAENPLEEVMSIPAFMQIIQRNSFVSRLRTILTNSDLPVLFISAIFELLRRFVAMDYRSSISIITQLDFWTLITELVKTQTLKCSQMNERRPLYPKFLRGIEEISKNIVISEERMMSQSSILGFVVECVTMDKSLGGQLLKTTSIVGNTMELVSEMEEMEGDAEQMDSLIRQIACFLHLVLSSVDKESWSIQCLFPSTSSDSEGEDDGGNTSNPCEHYFHKILKLFSLSNNLDTKLCIARFLSFILIHIGDEELFVFDAHLYDHSNTYAVQFLTVLYQIFIQIYQNPLDHQQESNSESYKKDISACLSVLLGRAHSAKHSVFQTDISITLLNKIEILHSVIQYSRLQQIVGSGKSEYNYKSQQSTYSTRLPNKLTPVNKKSAGRTPLYESTKSVMLGGGVSSLLLPKTEIGDIDTQKRDLIRLMQICRNLIYQSTSIIHLYPSNFTLIYIYFRYYSSICGDSNSNIHAICIG